MKLQKMQERYSHLMPGGVADVRLSFPSKLNYEECGINYEIEFTAILVLNPQICRSFLGIERVEFTPAFPDIKAYPIGSDEPIYIELEYEATGYRAHKRAWGGCDLIVSFVRGPNTREVCGVPVWSFYKHSAEEDCMVWCLQEDQDYHDKKQKEDLRESKKLNRLEFKGHWLRQDAGEILE